MGITSGRTIKPRRAESSKPTARLVRKRPRCTPCTAREPDYISTEEIDARPRYYSRCERDSPSPSRWMCRRTDRIPDAACLAFVADNEIVRLERSSGTRREIEFSSFPPGFLFFPFSRLVSIFFFSFFTSRIWRRQESFHRVIISGIALDTSNFWRHYYCERADYESRIITCSDLVCRTRGSCAL